MAYLHPNAHYEERTQHNNQHTNWFYSAAFATIALVALLQDLERFNGQDKFKDQEKKITWVGSAIICALGLSGIGFLMGLFLRHRFVGNMLEWMLVSLLRSREQSPSFYITQSSIVLLCFTLLCFA